MSYRIEDLTPEEKKAIRALERAAKIWPESLWLFSGDGTLCVMKKDENGKKVMRIAGGSESVGADAIITSIKIENDGGNSSRK